MLDTNFTNFDTMFHFQKIFSPLIHSFNKDITHSMSFMHTNDYYNRKIFHFFFANIDHTEDEMNYGIHCKNVTYALLLLMQT